MPATTTHGSSGMHYQALVSYNAHHMVRTARSLAATAAATGGTYEIDNRRHSRDGQLGLSLSLSIPNSFTATK